jgi:hypothetical protein
MSVARPDSRGTFGVLFCILIVAVIPWEIVLGGLLLWRWCYDRGWHYLGAFVLVLDIVIALVSAVWLVRMLIRWLADAIRRIRGLEEKR